MIVTVSGLVMIFLFAFLGYIKGVWRILTDFTALLLAALLSGAVSPVFLPVVNNFDFIPRTLKPLTSVILTMLILFLFLLICGRIIIRFLEKERRTREVLEKKIWERFAGAALGGIWGLFLLVLILMGLLIAGNLQDTIKKFNNQRAGLKKQVGTSSEKIKPTTQREIPAAGSFSVIKKHIEDSPFGYIARKLNPLDAEVMNRFKDLMIIIGDPVLFAKFRSHKSIIRVTGHPKFLKVAEDTNIKFLLKNKQYFKLLDHPKIASLVNDKEIFRELKKIDFKKVFVQVLKE